MDGSDSNGGDNNQGSSTASRVKFQSQLVSIAALQMNIDEESSLTLGEVFFLALGYSKAVVSRLEQCLDVKNTAPKRASSIYKDRKDAKQTVLFSMDRARGLPVQTEASTTDLVALHVEQDSPIKSMVAKYMVMKGLQDTVRSQSDYVDLRKLYGVTECFI